MTSFRLLFEEGELGIDGYATYSRRDFALEYASEIERIPVLHPKFDGSVDSSSGHGGNASVFLVADTLTLRFDGSRTLIALDAYTNYERWSKDVRSIPEQASRRGWLRIVWDAEFDRIRIHKELRYAFIPEAQRLHILLGSDVILPEYFEVGTGLKVGLAAGEICEIILDNLKMF